MAADTLAPKGRNPIAVASGGKRSHVAPRSLTSRMLRAPQAGRHVMIHLPLLNFLEGLTS